MLLLSMSLAHARAIPLGNPGRTASTGLVEVQAVGGATTDPVQVVSACDAEEGNCEANAYDRSGVARVNIRPHDAIGFWADFGFHVDAVSALRHSAVIATGPSGGLHLAMPGTGIRPAFSVRGQLITSQNQERDEDTQDVVVTSEHRAIQVDAAALALWGSSEGGVNVWAGPVASVYDDHKVVNFDEEDISLDLSSTIPVGMSIGGEAISAKIGSPWKERSARLSVGLEFRAIDAWGTSGWIGVGW